MRSEVRVLPPIFLERLGKILPPGKLDSVANTFSETKPTTFRVNTLKTDPQMVREALERQGFQLEAVHWIPGAFIVKVVAKHASPLRALQETNEYKNGEIYVQNLSSMIPPLVLDPKPGEFVLDLAAAPGSKTTQIASMMKGGEKIVACDNNKIRFFKLKANLKLQGAENVETILGYGEAIGKKRPDFFDKALLDAPCSSEGRFCVNEPASFGYWKPAKVHEMAQKQKKLIFSAIQALKPGGMLVYSTCTFAPEENEAVLDWAFQKFENQIEMQEIRLNIPNQMAGILSWEGKSFRPDVRKAVRIIPNAQMEGFFIAKLKKLSLN